METGPKILYHRRRCVKCGACAAYTDLEQCADACFYDAYERVGVTITTDDLASKLLRDKVFYDQSSGGVTYSGGEAAMQADFFLELTRLLKAEDVHVALDTSGYTPRESLMRLANAVDLVLYDIKTLDSDLHMKLTGVDNALILENAREIAKADCEMIVRLIIIPGVNDSDKEMIGRLDFVRSLGSVKQVDLLKFHKLGVGKYEALGLDDPMQCTPECPDELAGRMAKIAEDMGFIVTIGG